MDEDQIRAQRIGTQDGSEVHAARAIVNAHEVLTMGRITVSYARTQGSRGRRRGRGHLGAKGAAGAKRRGDERENDRLAFHEAPDPSDIGRSPAPNAGCRLASARLSPMRS
jgi:hypothetical protein